MGTVNTALEREAESIFNELGYAVSADGGALRAKRKWRTVQVTPVPGPEAPTPKAGEYHCLVTWSEHVDTLERTLKDENPEYEWAIIGVSEDDDYVIAR